MEPEPLHHSAFMLMMLFDMLLSDISQSEIPCIYEGRISTVKNWFGYLANITVVMNGRMLFELMYPVKHGCLNVLFYSDEQVAFIHPQMTCWQKEYLLKPEKDQILRLTPRFSWSGCQLDHRAGQLMYVCEGGRSFAVDDDPRRASTWHLAVSNCATQSGLDLNYRFVVYGAIGRCQYHFHEAGESLSLREKPKAELRLAASSKWYNAMTQSPCIVEGDVNSLEPWFGFLVNMTLHRGGGFQFHFRFPVVASVPVMSQILSVLLYTADDVGKLDATQTCWQRYTLISQRRRSEQLIEIGSKSSWNGCASDNSSGSLAVVCRSERRFDDARQFHFAVSNCRHREHGLHLQYRLEVYGYDRVEQYCISCRVYSQIMLVVLCTLISRTTIRK